MRLMYTNEQKNERVRNKRGELPKSLHGLPPAIAQNAELADIAL